MMELDKVDVAILRLLQDDSRTSFRVIAKKIGISVPTVSSRVAKLEELGVIRNYPVQIDVDKLGKTTLLVIVKCQPQLVQNVANSLAAINEVRKVFILRGLKVAVEATLPSPDAIDKFLEKFSTIDGITDYEYFTTTRRMKDEPSATIDDSLVALLECSECHKTIEGEAIRKTMDSKDYYFCCKSCDKLFSEKYDRIKAGI